MKEFEKKQHVCHNVYSSAEELLQKLIRVDSLLLDTNGEEVQLQKFLFDCPIDKTKFIYDGRDGYTKCKRYGKKMG